MDVRYIEPVDFDDLYWRQSQDAIDLLYIYLQYYNTDVPTTFEIVDAWSKISKDKHRDWLDFRKMSEKEVAKMLRENLQTPEEKSIYEEKFIIESSKALSHLINAVGSNNIKLEFIDGAVIYTVESPNVRVTLKLEEQ